MAEMTTDQKTKQAVEQATAAMRALNLEAAHTIAHEAIDAGSEHPFLLKVQALWLHEHGQLTEALQTFHHARELAPDDPMILNGIAGVLSAMGAHANAMKILETSLRMAPNLVTTNYMRGWTFEALRDYQSAQRAYERTLVLRPGHVQALSGLSTTAVRLQNFALARASAEQALALAPGEPTASMALALADIAGGNPAAAESRMRALLTQKQPYATRAVACGVLGDALDAMDKTDAAFDAYTAENAALKSLHAAGSAQEQRLAGELAALAQNLEAAPSNWPKPAAGTASGGTQTHVFLLGFMRSGTTLLEQVLASHPDVVTLEETNLLVEAAQTFLGDVAGLSRLQVASEGDLNALRDAYWQGVEGQGLDPKDKIFVDKHPLNTAKLPLIAKLFPDARILFAVRDPRDVVFSCYRRHFEVHAFTYSFLTLESAARVYDAVMTIGAWSRRNLPLSFRLLRYEDLVADFEGQVRGACDFIGVEWDDKLRDFAAHAASREITSQSASQVRRGLYAEGAGRWRAYANKLAAILPILEPWIREFGYGE